MTDIFETVRAWVEIQIQENDVFAGVVGGSIFASLLYWVRSIPLRLWQLLKRVFTRFFSKEITVTNARLDSFDRILGWLSENGAVNRQGRFMADYSYTSGPVAVGEEDEDNQFSGLTVPLGVSWFLRGRTLYVVNRTREEGGHDLRMRETLSLRIWSRRRDRVEEVLNAGMIEDNSKREVRMYCGYGWRHLRNPYDRPVASVFLKDGQLASILTDVENFLSRKEVYENMGIPHQRGYLFEGPPGTGKSTLASVIAGHFNLHLSILPLGSLTDQSLANAFSEIPRNSLILLDDIDEATSVATGEKSSDEEKLSLAGLFQAMDGMFGSSGTVVVMTTNHPDKLDQRLIRSGRVDVKEHIGLIEEPVVREMVNYHLSEHPEWMSEIVYPAAPASIQGSILKELWK